MAKFRYSLNGGSTWTIVDQALPYAIPSTAQQEVLIETIGTTFAVPVATTLASATAVAGLVNSTTGSSFTFTAASIANATVGPANTDREVIIPVVVFAGANRSFSSVTVAGVSASLIAGSSVVNSASGSNFTMTAMYRATLGSAHGATGDIVVTMSGSSAGCAIGVEVITGIGSILDVDTFTGAVFDQPTTASVSYADGCIAIGMGGYSTAISGGNRRKTHAKLALTGSGTLTVTPTYTGTDLNFGSGLVEESGADVQVLSGGSPATAGSIVIISPVT